MDKMYYTTWEVIYGAMIQRGMSFESANRTANNAACWFSQLWRDAKIQREMNALHSRVLATASALRHAY